MNGLDRSILKLVRAADGEDPLAILFGILVESMLRRTVDRVKRGFSFEARVSMGGIQSKDGFICDSTASHYRPLIYILVDGVLYHQDKAIPGAIEFIDWMQKNGKKFIFLTNSSERSPEQLSTKLKSMGISVSTCEIQCLSANHSLEQVAPDHFYTSGMATAEFLSYQKKNGKAFVLGGHGVKEALVNCGE